MIVAKLKPIEEIIQVLDGFQRVLVAGCDGCVTVCEAGGWKEVQVLASTLRLSAMQRGREVEIGEISLTRQCDKEYLRRLLEVIHRYEAVLSLACGAGVQFLAEMYRDKPILPAVDTCFIGVTEERGVWTERCQACGQCVLATTGGICPISRCSKRMLNGPCGGSTKGKCEIGKDTDCGWYLIYERLKQLGQLERFEHPVEPKDWRSSRAGGPRRVVREDLRP